MDKTIRPKRLPKTGRYVAKISEQVREPQDLLTAPDQPTAFEDEGLEVEELVAADPKSDTVLPSTATTYHSSSPHPAPETLNPQLCDDEGGSDVPAVSANNHKEAADVKDHEQPVQASDCGESAKPHSKRKAADREHLPPKKLKLDGEELGAADLKSAPAIPSTLITYPSSTPCAASETLSPQAYGIVIGEDIGEGLRSVREDGEDAPVLFGVTEYVQWDFAQCRYVEKAHPTPLNYHFDDRSSSVVTNANEVPEIVRLDSYYIEDILKDVLADFCDDYKMTVDVGDRLCIAPRIYDICMGYLNIRGIMPLDHLELPNRDLVSFTKGLLLGLAQTMDSSSVAVTDEEASQAFLRLANLLWVYEERCNTYKP